MEKKVSLKDIAARVGVSTALVSYVLNNQKEGRINKEVAKKIRETAEQLNYRPNQLARGLKTNKTYTIGLIVADIANPFFSSLARVIEDEADDRNYTVIFGSSEENADRSRRLVEVLLDRQVDGIIIAPTEGDEPHLRLLQQRKVPFVLIDRSFPGIEANSVVIDNFTPAYESIVHLASCGRKRIGMIGFKTSLHHLLERKRGYRAALEAQGLPFSEQWLHELELDASKEAVENAIQQLLSLPEPVDALFFASNKLSTMGLKYINRLPVRVPEQLALVSFDQSDATDLFYAPLTHVQQPLKEMGQQAVQVLLNSISNSEQLTHVLLQAKLVAGASTGSNP